MKRTLLLFVSVFSLLAPGAWAADIDTLETRLVTYYTSNNILTGATNIVSSTTIAGYLSTQAADGSWYYIAYTTRAWGPVKGAVYPYSPRAHLQNLLEMASAYVRPGQIHYHSAALLNGISNGLTYWFDNWADSVNYVVPADKINPYDYYFTHIGIQMLLGPTLLLMEPYLSPAVLAAGATHLKDPSNEGSNLAEIANQAIWRGLLNESLADIDLGLNAIKNHMLPAVRRGGPQADRSIQQHAPLLYSGMYGRVFNDAATFWEEKTRGIPSFAFTPAQIATLSDLFLDGEQWMVRRGYWDQSTRGREISRPDTGTSGSRATPLNRMIALGTARKAEFEAFKNHISGTNDGALTGDKHFWNSDYHAHRRNDYHVSVLLVSTRTRGTELNGGENKLAYYLPFGLTTILRSGVEYKNIYPVWDWARLPGVTSPHRPSPPALTSDQSFRGPTGFVGGASDGVYGAVGFDLKLDGVTGRKAWFFFDQEFVALGAGITAANGIPVFTSLNQTLLSTGGVQASYDGAAGSAVAKGQYTLGSPKWVHHDGVGYVFPAPGNVELKAAQQTGNWSSIGGTSKSAAADVFSLWFDHGTNPASAQYEYRVVLAIDAGAMPAYLENSRVRTIRNTSDLQAVRNDALQVAGLVFYVPGEVEIRAGLTVRADTPCVVLVKEEAEKTTVTAADPVGAVAELTVVLSYAGGGSSPLVFTLPGGVEKGRSVTQFVLSAGVPATPPSAPAGLRPL